MKMLQEMSSKGLEIFHMAKLIESQQTGCDQCFPKSQCLDRNKNIPAIFVVLQPQRWMPPRQTATPYVRTQTRRNPSASFQLRVTQSFCFSSPITFLPLRWITTHVASCDPLMDDLLPSTLFVCVLHCVTLDSTCISGSINKTCFGGTQPNGSQ